MCNDPKSLRFRLTWKITRRCDAGETHVVAEDFQYCDTAHDLYRQAKKIYEDYGSARIHMEMDIAPETKSESA